MMCHATTTYLTSARKELSFAVHLLLSKMLTLSVRKKKNIASILQYVTSARMVLYSVTYQLSDVTGMEDGIGPVSYVSNLEDITGQGDIIVSTGITHTKNKHMTQITSTTINITTIITITTTTTRTITTTSTNPTVKGEKKTGMHTEEIRTLTIKKHLATES